MARKIALFTVYEVEEADHYSAGEIVARVRGKAATQREVEARTTGGRFAWAVSETFERAADAAVAAFGRR